jgi:hypothetical protein
MHMSWLPRLKRPSGNGGQDDPQEERSCGAASDASEAGSMARGAVLANHPIPERTSRPTGGTPPSSSSFRWRPEQAGGHSEDGDQAAGAQEDKLVNLIHCLSGPQANDSGWPVFKGRFVEYPRFKKVWWAYRRTYHGHMQDQLVSRTL